MVAMLLVGLFSSVFALNASNDTLASIGYVTVLLVPNPHQSNL